MDLQTLETHLEEEVSRWESSAIKIGEWLNRIKESGAYKEAGYRYFQTYYRERWQQRIGRSWSSAEKYMIADNIAAEVEGPHLGEDLSEGGPQETHLRYPITDHRQALDLGRIKDPEERLKVWNEYNEANEPGNARKNLDERIRQHLGEPSREESIERAKEEYHGRSEEDKERARQNIAAERAELDRKTNGPFEAVATKMAKINRLQREAIKEYYALDELSPGEEEHLRKLAEDNYRLAVLRRDGLLGEASVDWDDELAKLTEEGGL